ncbi:DUF2931 family protein [Gynuella sp.]|uniref:DUF2931 family protein n=1 Tax=Gynuella sp. TaxID=2969146 RepID=UPI003D0CCEE1
MGASASAGWVPLPHTVRARWFSYRTQTFYEATVEIPKTKQKQIRQSLKKYGTEVYLQNLAVCQLCWVGVSKTPGKSRIPLL